MLVEPTLCPRFRSPPNATYCIHYQSF